MIGLSNAHTPMIYFLYGGVAIASFVIGLLFFKYFRKTGDQLLMQFGIAFWLLGAERIFLTITPQESESRSFVFLLRLSAFLLIIVGIMWKNRKSTPEGQRRVQQTKVPLHAQMSAKGGLTTK